MNEPNPRAKTNSMEASRKSFIEQAFLEYEAPLIGYAYGFLKDESRARDVVQDTFIRLCKQDPEKVQKNLKAWLFTVCRNRALDVIRKQRKMQSMDEPNFQQTLSTVDDSPHDKIDQEERIGQLMQYLDQLSENQKNVIIMKFRDGLSYKEISKKTGLSSGNIGYLIHEGLKRLRQLLPADFSQQ